MSLHFVSGNVFDREADVRVNTVNCVGVMGAGVALQFKRRYPAMYLDYKRACTRGEVQPGRLHVWQGPDVTVVNLPTKRHWKNPSRYEDVESGVKALAEYLCALGPVTVTLPPPGCANGGLDWRKVMRIVQDHLGAALCPTGSPEVYAYFPQGWAFRSHNDCPVVHSGDTCPNCGYYRHPVPEWLRKAFFDSGRRGKEIVFGLRGKRYRVVSLPSVNDACGGHHYTDYVSVVETSERKPELEIGDISRSLKRIFDCEKIEAKEMVDAIHG